MSLSVVVYISNIY